MVGTPPVQASTRSHRPESSTPGRISTACSRSTRPRSTAATSSTSTLGGLSGLIPATWRVGGLVERDGRRYRRVRVRDRVPVRNHAGRVERQLRCRRHRRQRGDRRRVEQRAHLLLRLCGNRRGRRRERLVRRRAPASTGSHRYEPSTPGRTRTASSRSPRHKVGGGHVLDVQLDNIFGSSTAGHVSAVAVERDRRRRARVRVRDGVPVRRDAGCLQPQLRGRPDRRQRGDCPAVEQRARVLLLVEADRPGRRRDGLVLRDTMTMVPNLFAAAPRPRRFGSSF